MARLLPASANSIGADLYGKRVLRRGLNSWHIWLITISGVIGAGFISSSSYALSVAGPGGALIAFAVAGLVTIAVMQGISEMMQLWPIPNPMVEFVSTFVDKDLAVVTGIGYWYAYATALPVFVINTVDLLDYWDIPKTWKLNLFVFVPIAILIINTCRVEVYGMIEFIGGLAKLLLICALLVVMLVVNTGVKGSKYIGSAYLGDGIKTDGTSATSQGAAVCIAISLATFAYLGTELAAVTAFEARRPHTDIKAALQNTALLVAAAYLVAMLIFGLDVKWNNPSLPSYKGLGWGQLLGGNVSSDIGNRTSTISYSAPVIAVREAQLGGGVWTAFFIFFMLSSANTALYVASRAFFGMARSIQVDPSSSWVERTLAKTATAHHATLSPDWPLLISALAFSWLPFVRLGTGYTLLEVQEIVVNIGSTSLVLVWASQCLAYLRFHHWRTLHQHCLTGPTFSKVRHRGNFAGRFTMCQPGLAWLGLISTLWIIIVANSAAMWNGEDLGAKFASAYIGPLLWLVSWLGLKAWRYYYYRSLKFLDVNLSAWSDFAGSVRHLNDLVYPQDFPPVSTELPEDHPRIISRRPVPKVNSGGAEDPEDLISNGRRRTLEFESKPPILRPCHSLDMSEKYEDPPGDFVPLSRKTSDFSSPSTSRPTTSRGVQTPAIRCRISIDQGMQSEPRIISVSPTPEIVVTRPDEGNKKA
jgi:yeast amino acid transporter